MSSLLGSQESWQAVVHTAMELYGAFEVVLVLKTEVFLMS